MASNTDRLREAEMTDANRVDDRGARSRILRKVGVALAVGTFAYAVTEFTGQPRIWSMTLSVFIGGVVLVIQFLIDFESRLAKVEATNEVHNTKVKEMVQSGFTQISEFTELLSLVETSALRADALMQLIRHSARIDPASPPLLLKLAQAEIGRISSFLKELSEGNNILYEGEDRDWLLGLARNSSTSIDATSVTTADTSGGDDTDGGLWTSDLGQRYLEAQREAIQRGVRIRRIFVIARRASHIDDLSVLDVCRQQQMMGVEARILDLAESPTVRRDALLDFVVFDSSVAYEATVASRLADTAGPAILNTRLELRPDRVAGHMQRFEDLWQAARVPRQPSEPVSPTKAG